jgi:hypothetical protein
MYCILKTSRSICKPDFPHPSADLRRKPEFREPLLGIPVSCYREPFIFSFQSITVFPWINTRNVSIVHDNQRLIWEGDLHRCRLTTKSYCVGFTVPISTAKSSQTSNKVRCCLVLSRPSSSLINFTNPGLIFYSFRLASALAKLFPAWASLSRSLLDRLRYM